MFDDFKQFVSALISDKSLRQVYHQRRLLHPNEGNRTPINLLACLFLVVSLSMVLSAIPGADEATQFGFMTRHIIAFFALIIFLFIDGSPETLGLGLFMGFEAVAKAIDYSWITVPHPQFVMHFLYQMGDILRIYFFLHLSRMIRKETLPWLMWGAVLSLPYAALQEFGAAIPNNPAAAVRSYRDLFVGTVGIFVCLRSAWAIRSSDLPWRVCALGLAALGGFEQILDPVSQMAPAVFAAIPEYAHIRAMIRPGAYYVLAISSFINISTLENRVKALSSAKAQTAIDKVVQESRVNEVIAKTSQMLAHDVRKPFSMLSVGMDMLSNCTSMAEVKTTLNRLTTEVERAMTQVSALITDVIDIGATNTPATEPVSLRSMLEKAINEVFRFSSNDEIRFEYRLRHSRDVMVDPLKMSRVFLNIIENASHAIGAKPATIWFEAWDEFDGESFKVHTVVGNTGSVVPPELIERIFEPFCTHGKRDGTGLGLAVARHVMGLHGGKIWCQSHRDLGTEFHLVIPAALGLIDANPAQPATSADVTRSWKQVKDVVQTELVQARSDDSNHWLTEAAVSQLAIRAGRSIRVLIVDDESLYCQALATQIGRLSRVAPHVQIHTATNPRSAIDIAKAEVIDLAICDIDLGSDVISGFALAQQLKSIRSETYICMHSNRSSKDDVHQASKSGADIFLLKPLASEHILKLFWMALRGDETEPTRPGPGTDAAAQPVVLVVDDDVFLTEAWAIIMSDAKVLTYLNPAQLLASINSKTLNVNTVALVILDQHFGSQSTTLGQDLALELRQKMPGVPIVLSTNAIELHGQKVDGIDMAIDKHPMKYAEIAALLQEARAAGPRVG